MVIPDPLPSNARDVLGQNLSRLMKDSGGRLDSAVALEKATADAGNKIGRSTINRICNGTTPVNLDYIEVLGRVFKKKPWEMLHPALGDVSQDIESMDLAGAVDLLARTMEQFPEPIRIAIGQRLATLAQAPDSQTTKQALIGALGGEKSGESRDEQPNSNRQAA